MNEVLVVGAGPVGLVTACELARQGLRPRLIDILEVPNTQSRAVGVHARSQEMFDALGVLPRIEARARRIVAIELCRGQDGGRPLARIDVTGLPTRRSCMLDLPQTATEDVLRERAAEFGISIERGIALVALHPDADGVEVILRTTRGEQTTRVGWVIGADGAHSTTRRLVGTTLAGSFHGQHFLLADVDIDTDLSPDTMRMFAHPDGVAGIFPMAAQRARLMFAVDTPSAGDPTVEQVQGLTDARMGVPLTVLAAHWLTYFEVHHGQVPQYRFGRVLLAGDAAHIHSPAGGQGMNTGMQDGANLAWKVALVASGRADPALLDSYQAERHPIGAAVIRSTTAMTTMLTSTGVAAAARDAALLMAGHSHRVGDVAAATLAELTVAYHGSALVAASGRLGHGAPRPGTHAPDPAGLTDAQGTPTWIGDLLRRPGHLLLVRTADPAVVAALHAALGDIGTVTRVVTDPDAAQAGDLVDTAAAIQQYYGIRDDGFVLVRPDGYIGLLAAPADPSILTAHLIDALRIRTTALR